MYKIAFSKSRILVCNVTMSFHMSILIEQVFVAKTLLLMTVNQKLQEFIKTDS